MRTQNPTVSQLKQYAVNRQGEFEVTRQTLYDFQAYASAGQTQLTFFQLPIGQSGKTRDDTNMESAGQLPAPKNFLVESIEIYLFPADNIVTVNNAADTVVDVVNFANDVQAVQESGNLDFFIGSKSYLGEAPLGRFPPKTCLKTEFAFAAVVNQTAAADEVDQISADYAVFAGRPYFVDPNITLVPTQNFNVTLNWATAVALPSGSNARVGVVLDGLLYRLAQ